ncbi:MAG: alpha/beta hydrolase [Candidatus Eremiobacteraeota bacterium]|nr:alpha/beta hydrolase [Candidatus Eremiobacteraeota bacterium]MBV9647989.1 alpha/beta hydrolase [Candidatus Eremiobacteraeota bacterium]
MERRITFDDGATTALESWGSTGPSILCIHGITSSRKSWAHLATRLALAYRVWAYDQRGHGDAARTHGPMTHERSVRDLATIVQEIGEPVEALIGHSWGGVIALLGGLQRLGERVIAIDPMVHQVQPWKEDFVDDVAADLELDPVAREREYLHRYASWGELEVAGKIHAVRDMSLESIERLGRDNQADQGGWDLRDRITDYPIPLLALLAGQDSVVTDEDKRWLDEHLGPNARIVTFDDDGHNLHRTNFDRFVEDVNAFLATS